MNDLKTKKVLIIGGGFAGIRAALDLCDLVEKSKKKDQKLNLDIRLLTDKTHFEYHAFLYKVVNGASPLEVCIPLSEIFKGKKVEITKDTVKSIYLKEKRICGISDCHYSYDYLILALGSETEYFGISGLKEYSYGLKTIHEALALNRHLHKTFTECHLAYDNIQKECLVHIVVVGGGPAGVEVAGELASYTKELAAKHEIDHEIIKIDLIEMSNRILPQMSEETSDQVFKRLKNLNVNIFLQQALLEANVEDILLKDMKMNTKTVIWTAGTKANKLYKTVSEFKINKKGQVEVDDYLRPINSGVYDNNSIIENIFIVGDAAATSQNGLARIALNHGSSAANNIVRLELNKPIKKLEKIDLIYAVPIGKKWAAVEFPGIKWLKIYGVLGWIFRKIVDLHFFLSILPLSKSIILLVNNRSITDNCETCQKHLE